MKRRCALFCVEYFSRIPECPSSSSTDYKSPIFLAVFLGKCWYLKKRWQSVFHDWELEEVKEPCRWEGADVFDSRAREGNSLVNFVNAFLALKIKGAIVVCIPFDFWLLIFPPRRILVFTLLGPFMTPSRVSAVRLALALEHLPKSAAQHIDLVHQNVSDLLSWCG